MYVTYPQASMNINEYSVVHLLRLLKDLECIPLGKDIYYADVELYIEKVLDEK